MDGVTLTISALVSGAVSTGLTTWIAKGIETRFATDLETFKSTLRNDEERIKADLAQAGREIEALRSGALSGLTARQSELYKRRLQAVDKVMTVKAGLAPLVALVGYAKVINLSAVRNALQGPANERQAIIKFIEILLKTTPEIKDLKLTAQEERPYLSEWTWAVFTTYSSTLFYFYVTFTVMKMGQAIIVLAGPEYMVDLVKKVLPHQSGYLDEHGETALAYLVDEMETTLIAACKADLENRDADTATVARAREIMMLASKATETMPDIAAGLGSDVPPPG